MIAVATAALLAPPQLAAQPPSGADDAFRPGVSMLPDSTQGMVAVDDLPALLDRWTRTSLSELQHDEAMRPFLESQRKNRKAYWSIFTLSPYLWNPSLTPSEGFRLYVRRF